MVALVSPELLLSWLAMFVFEFCERLDEGGANDAFFALAGRKDDALGVFIWDTYSTMNRRFLGSAGGITNSSNDLSEIVNGA